MARRHRRDLEDDEDDAVTPDKIEKIELEAVLAADENLDIIIAWLKRKHPIGGCTVHPEDHCFHNKLGHWILDTYKLLVWAIEIKRRKTTGTRPPILDPVFLDDMAEEPEVVETVSSSRDTTASNSSTALVSALTPTLPYTPTMPWPTLPWQYAQYPVHGGYPGVPGVVWQPPTSWPPYPYHPPGYPHPSHQITRHHNQ